LASFEQTLKTCGIRRLQICARILRRLARFPAARNRAIDKKSRQIKNWERILLENVDQLFRNSLSSAAMHEARFAALWDGKDVIR